MFYLMISDGFQGDTIILRDAKYFHLDHAVRAAMARNLQIKKGPLADHYDVVDELGKIVWHGYSGGENK